MSKVEEYRNHAEECERMAQAANTPKATQQYLDMAQRWRDLAAHVRGDEKQKKRAAQVSAARASEQSNDHQ